jgi:Arc/MetJ-type ribon-helix-helix transcriptional regulator
MSADRTISLPEGLCEAAEKKFGHRFGSVEELVRATLRELLRDNALAMDESEQRIVEERLKGLGYI